ncbi:MAG: putative rane protein [Herbinix sp.]|jgi:preprotein translocase subunit SecE|nr:putative rane protein [Herbinix sp.]
MGETTNSTTEKAPKKSWFKGLKSEYNKIVWPDKETLAKHSVAVISVTVVLGAVIYLLDFVIELGIGIIIG